YENRLSKFEQQFDILINEVIRLNKKVENLEKENIMLKNEVARLQEENDKLNGKICKNSTNSGISSSKDENVKKINHRKKSDKKQGGQKGRKGKTLTVEAVEKLIKDNDVEVTEENYGDLTSKETVVKYILDVVTKVKIRKIVIHGKQDDVLNTDIPIECLGNSSVVYGNNIKVLVGIMAEEEVIAVDRMTEFIEILTNHKLRISHGSIINWIKSLSKKCKKVIKKIIQKIVKSKVIYTDGTNTKVNGKKAYIRNYSTDTFTVYKACRTKTKKEIGKHNILNRFTLYIMHDHETGLYFFGIRDNHLECWIHLGRDLLYFQENIESIWSKQMWEFGWNIKIKREELKEKEIYSFNKEEIFEYEKQYDEILERGFIENSKCTSKYFKSKEKSLLNRLVKYKTQYLNFIKDFSLPFDDNLSERDLRPTKTKKKVSGGHRSYEGLKDYCNIRSIISSCKKQCIDYYQVLKDIMDNKAVCVTSEGIQIPTK
ncbi:MAG: transposase, partial [Bacilli bacterium]